MAHSAPLLCLANACHPEISVHGSALRPADVAEQPRAPWYSDTDRQNRAIRFTCLCLTRVAADEGREDWQGPGPSPRWVCPGGQRLRSVSPRRAGATLAMRFLGDMESEHPDEGWDGDDTTTQEMYYREEGRGIQVAAALFTILVILVAVLLVLQKKNTDGGCI